MKQIVQQNLLETILRTLNAIGSTIIRTLVVFYKQGLFIFTPLVLLLLFLALIFFFINAVSPLAPFIYSLI